MRSRIRPRCAISLGKSIAVAFSNSRSPREYEFATDTLELVRAYYKISNPQVRKRLFEMVKVIGASFEKQDE